MCQKNLKLEFLSLMRNNDKLTAKVVFTNSFPNSSWIRVNVFTHLNYKRIFNVPNANTNPIPLSSSLIHYFGLWYSSTINTVTLNFIFEAGKLHPSLV
jgi:hypothetical protein